MARIVLPLVLGLSGLSGLIAGTAGLTLLLFFIGFTSWALSVAEEKKWIALKNADLGPAPSNDEPSP